MGDWLGNMQSHTGISSPHRVGVAPHKGVKTYIDPQEDGGAQGQSNFQPVRFVMWRRPNVEFWPRWSWKGTVCKSITSPCRENLAFTCISAFNSPFTLPSRPPTGTNVRRDHISRPGPPVEPGRLPLSSRLLGTLWRLESGRVANAPGRIPPPRVCRTQPAKWVEEGPKIHSQRPRGVGWHLAEGRWRVIGSRESGWGHAWAAGYGPAKVTARRARAAAAPCRHGPGSPWEEQAGMLDRPARGGTLTAARESGRGQQPGEGAQQRGRRHLAGLGSASQQPRSPAAPRLWGRRPAERPLAGGGAGLAGSAAAPRDMSTPRIAVRAGCSSCPGLSSVC